MDIKKDFESFVNEPADTSASSIVLQKIHREIAEHLPSRWKVASKLGVAHLLGSLVTLMSCSQFGIQLFFDGGGLMHYFMKINPSLCYTFCGALYLSISFLFARILLNHEEWLLILRSRALSISSLALLSLGGLALASHEVTFEAGILWLFGAALGGEFVTLIKSPLLLVSKFTSPG